MKFDEWWDRHGRAIYQAGKRDPKALAEMSWNAALEAAPTKAMLDAMVDAFRESTCFDDVPFESASEAARDAYRRMLVAKANGN